MSVIGEVVGIVACVAGVISAYRDGGAIIEKIKIKRAAKRAPPPPRLLEESIDAAPEEIEREKHRGIQRFGRSFEAGDHVVVIALQQITIQLQSSLLVKLREATFDDEVKDFTYLVDAADIGRDRTIAALLEFRQRLMLAAPLTEIASLGMDSPGVPPSRPQALRAMHGQGATTRSSPALVAPNRMGVREESDPSRDTLIEEDATSGADDAQPPRPRRKRSSLKALFKSNRSHSGSSERASQAISEDNRSTPKTPAGPSGGVPVTAPFRNPSVQREPSGRRPSTQPRQDPKYTYQDWEDDPSQIWGSKSPATVDERRDTIANIPPSSPGSPANSTRPPAFPTPLLSPSTITLSLSPIPTPTSENNYLGFCPSAWRLQTGDRKALRRTQEFNDGWSQSSVHYLACTHSKCAFAGKMSLGVIWTKVWVVEVAGLKFRWPFLAKSHVVQSKVKDGAYAYQCLFCVFTGGKTPVIFGTDQYLEHVRQHRRQVLGEVVLDKTKCIVDRIADDSESFDINLFPLSAEESIGRRESAVLSDDLLGLGGVSPGKTSTSTEAQDSLFGANGPWNEGLSDFHWVGRSERLELE